MKTRFAIADILPFYRYAVVPENEGPIGIPFYRKSAAVKFFNETQQAIPWFGCYLLRRCWFSSNVEVLDYYKGCGL